MIFGIGNEYQDVHADLYKLESGFSRWLCREKLANKCCYAINRPKIGVTSGLNWYCVPHPKFMIFGVVLS